VNLRPRSFRSKLLLLFVLVVTVAQFVTWFIVARYNEASARDQIDAELQQAATAFRRLVAYRNSLLATGVATAARDYQIKQLLVAEDTATLKSALESIQLVSESHVVSALTPEGRPLASTLDARPGDALYARLLAVAEADPRATPTASGFGYLDSQLYSLVVAPVVAPDLIAWLVLGFRIDRELAEDLKRITGVDLTFLDARGVPLATTLDDAAAQTVAAELPRLKAGIGSQEVRIGGGTALVAVRALATGDRQSAALALQYSLDEKLAPARETERHLLLVAVGSLLVAALLSIAFARRLTEPILALVGHTRRIARGDYRVQNTSYRDDELGRLAEAFDQMSLGLAERDRVLVERDRMRDLLEKNVSPEVAAQLIRDGATLDGEEREVTVLFADLRGFTTLSEQLAARDMFKLLNRYLDRMSGAIEAQGGVIDKFIGDAIMALFGAPVPQGDAADRAITAARDMERALAELNADLAAEGRAPLAIGVGINTARVLAGYIGSDRRLNYSVIGDGVNVASRLQSLTRTAEYRTNIIVSAATLRAARGVDGGGIATRPLGTVPVKGRAEPVEIFAVDAA
jgi:adenylate cyclase